MSTTDKMQFTVAADGKSMHIERPYPAALPQVWEAWTNEKILDAWWAPKPWKCETKTFRFNEDGYWHYCMKGPAGEEAWGIFFFEEIEAQSFYRGKDSFADADARILPDFPSMSWQVAFVESAEGTLVDIHIAGESPEAIQKQLEMGFREGFEMCLNNLEEWLKALEKIN